MRLKTIWTLPSMQLMERCRRTRELGVMTLAAKLPQRLKYWVTMGEISKAVSNVDSEVTGTTLDVLLKNLDAPKGLN